MDMGFRIAATSRPIRGMKPHIICVTIALTGCATTTPIPDGTRTVREVAHVLTRQEIVTGDIRTTRDNRGQEPIRLPGLHAALLKYGLKDEEIVDGSVILGRTQYYWFNNSSPERQFVRPAIVAKGVAVSVGNIVELEITKNMATVIAVKYNDLADGKCVYRRSEQSAVGKVLDPINPIGGAGARSLYCPEIQKAGWFPVMHERGVEWFSRPF
jgi:hypothetical protein